MCGVCVRVLVELFVETVAVAFGRQRFLLLGRWPYEVTSSVGAACC